MDLSRCEKIIGNDNINKLKNVKILLVGLGGVGGICFEMLIRSGISNITVIDYDTFEESNINRQILSNKNNVNNKKVLESKKRALNINEKCVINTYFNKVNKEFLDNLKPEFDYIIDACDDVNAKVELVKFAIKNSIKIISSCGTGNRIDPSKLYYTNIWKTNNDPLARKLRASLRKEGINYKLPVVASSELPIIKTSKYVGSMAFVPNCSGIFLSSYIINDVINTK